MDLDQFYSLNGRPLWTHVRRGIAPPDPLTFTPLVPDVGVPDRQLAVVLVLRIYIWCI